MRSPKVQDVMTVEVYSVRENTSFKDIASVLAKRKVSALPVVTGDREVVGVVSEADLLPKQIRQPAGWLARSFRRRSKASGRVAGDIMTSPAVTIGADATLVEAARALTKHGIKRLPVVDRYGKLVGIVSRSDLLCTFVRTDEELHDEIVHEVFERALCTPVTQVTVETTKGVVTLTGELERKSMIPIAVSLTTQVPGIVDVIDHLTFAFDDTHLKSTEPTNYGVTHNLWHSR